MPIKAERNGKKKTRILIVDQEAVFRFGLQGLLAADDQLFVCGAAHDLTQAGHLARQLKPDLIFLQAEVLGEKPSEELARLRSASAGCKLVITAPSMTGGESLRFIRAGASGVILKSVDPAYFIKCAHKVMENEIWLPKRDISQMARTLETVPIDLPRPVDSLTPREKAIVSYVIQGWRNREIAEHLSISEQTVKNHLRAVYDKVGVSDRLELALYVIYQRIKLPSDTAPTAHRNQGLELCKLPR